MRALLEAIKADLEGRGLFKDVFFTELLDPEFNDIPKGVRLPAVGIKDGAEDEPQDLSGGCLRRFVTIKVGVFDSAQVKPGVALLSVADLTNTVRLALNRNLLGLAQVSLAKYAGASETILIQQRARLLAQKIMTFRYELEE